MEKKLIISKMFLEETEEKNIRVCSNIKSDKDDYKLWFEIEKEYKEYILLERADAFIVALLPYAIKKELDIVVEDKISSKLYYQLTTYLIPMICKEANKRIIKIQCKLDNNTYNIAKAVGTGGSCGVDSLYTIAKHINLEEEEFNLTHLTSFNSGAFGDTGGIEARKVFKNRVEKIKEFCKQNNFKFLSVDSNMNEFINMSFFRTHSFRTLACALVMQKLFSKYYFSSTYEFNKTMIKIDDDMAYADILVLQCLSTEDITFYSTGIETNRMGKVKEIINYKPSYVALNVCLHNDVENCGICDKCKRTIMELDAIGKLELYKNVFDLDYFYKNKSKYLVWMLKNKRKKDDKYAKDMYNEYKKRQVKIPLYIKIISYIPCKRDIKNTLLKIFPIEKLEKKDTNIIKDGWTD